MQGFFQDEPPRRPGTWPDVLAPPAPPPPSPPASSRVHDPWAFVTFPVDWAEIEQEAAQLGCTVVDVVLTRADGY